MRVLTCKDGEWTHHDDLDATAAARMRETSDLVWVRGGGLSSNEATAIGSAFGLHALALEDARSPRQRPKVEDYPDLTFAVVRVPDPADGEHAWRTVGVFIGPDFVVTASEFLIPELDMVERHITGRRQVLRPDTLAHRILDALVDAWFPVMEVLEDEMASIEDEVIDAATPEMLGRIRDAKRAIGRMRKLTGPMRDAMLSLERAEHPNIQDATRLYLRDVADHTVRLAERLEHLREVALTTQELWTATVAIRQAEVANEQNQVMKRLTVIAALLLLPSLLAGIAGMNFPGIPDWPFAAVTAGILGVALTGLLVAWYRRWL